MSKQKPSAKKISLVVVAHPDDETLFFGGLILSNPKKHWHVVCATDGNADGQGAIRHRQFEAACKKLGVKSWSFFDLPDRFEQRLDVRLLQEKLGDLRDQKGHALVPTEVYTHGPTGEYGHPHHQDVSFAVHDLFLKKKIPVWGVAQNCPPLKSVHLKPALYAKKSAILAQIYFSETERFIHFLPSTFTEGFVKFAMSEVEHLHRYFRSEEALDVKKLKLYRWFVPYLDAFKKRNEARPF